MYQGKPIIGVAGGIGSGKSFIASLFGELGCVVISSDEQVAQAYRDPAVQQTLREWWSDQAIGPNGEVNRSFIASKVFADATQRKRLEELIHPWVHAAREAAMAKAIEERSDFPAFIWDTPLLFETGLHRQCDAVVFVESPNDLRRQRVEQNRGWEAWELDRREKSQWALDSKRKISDYVISNTANAGFAREQVKDVLSRILHQNQGV